jgi:Flp pilus assembly CpaF family ATPase
LRACVNAALNIVVSGGTGSGKTTVLNVLSSYIPDDERIVTIEDAAELQLLQPHVVRLETTPVLPDGTGRMDIRELVINSLRMRPDRIVIGECRGGEALDMLQAMNTGHDGSLTTVHANNPRDCVVRLETLCLMAGLDLPAHVIRQQIVSAVDLIVQQSRMRDGSRNGLNPPVCDPTFCRALRKQASSSVAGCLARPAFSWPAGASRALSTRRAAADILPPANALRPTTPLSSRWGRFP